MPASHQSPMKVVRVAMMRLSPIEGLAGLLALVVLGLNLMTDNHPLAILLDLALCAAAALCARRLVLGTVVTAVLLLVLALVPTEWKSMGEYASFLPVIAALMQRRTWVAAPASVVNLVALGWKTLRDFGAAVPDTALNMVGWVGAFALIWLVGLTTLWRREAETAQRELQRQRERSELARDLHDMVGHNVASIVMRAERAMLRGGADDDDLDFIVERGNDAIGEARSLMGTLRRDVASTRTVEDSRVAKTTSAVLDEPLARLEGAGFTVRVTTEGVTRAWPPSVLSIVSAVLREVTSNVIRHADPTGPCSLDFLHGERVALITITNRTRASRRADGWGIPGMGERMDALGGALHTTERDGTWTTTIALPLARVSPKEVTG